jgi:hypothetical protein
LRRRFEFILGASLKVIHLALMSWRTFFLKVMHVSMLCPRASEWYSHFKSGLYQ